MEVYRIYNSSGGRIWVGAPDEETALAVGKAAGFFRNKPKKMEIVTNGSMHGNNFTNITLGIAAVWHDGDGGKEVKFSIPPSYRGEE